MTKKILVIEDNEQNMYLVTYILEKSGYQVIQAYTGPDGLVLAEKHIPDLILLDIQLPTMDGYVVAAELLKRPNLARIPIIAVTSYAMAGDRERAMEMGFSGYIEKPINPDTFVSEVQEFLC